MEHRDPNQPDIQAGITEDVISYDEPEIAGLVTRAQGGDEAALEALLASTSERVRNIVKGPYSSDADIEDMEQQVRFRIWRYLSGFKGEARFATWATRIALNVRSGDSRKQAILTSRTRNVSEEVLGAQEDLRALDDVEQITLPDLEDFEFADYEKLMKALESLSPKSREVVVLRFMGDMSHAEIAARLGIEEGASKVRLFRALRDLREQMSEAPNDAIDSGKVFEDIINIANKNGFLETYWLLPTRHHDVLNWFMATGDLAATAKRTGNTPEECQAIVTTASQLLERGTNDYHQYAPGGESPSDEPLDALERYSRFKSYLAAVNISDDALRLLKERLSTELADNPESESKLHKTVRTIGRVVLHGVKFQERFPIQWLNEVAAEPEFRKYITQLTPQQQQIVALVTNGQTVQQAAETAGVDLYDFWNMYRVTVHELATLRLNDWSSLHAGHHHTKRSHLFRWRKGDYELLRGSTDIDQNAQYIFVAQRLFNRPDEDVAAELGMPIDTLNVVAHNVEQTILRQHAAAKAKK